MLGHIFCKPTFTELAVPIEGISSFLGDSKRMRESWTCQATADL